MKVNVNGQNITYTSFFLFCISKQFANVRLRLADVFVQDLWTIDDLWLPSIQHLANLSSHQSFTGARRAKQQDSAAVLHSFTLNTMEML